MTHAMRFANLCVPERKSNFLSGQRCDNPAGMHGGGGGDSCNSLELLLIWERGGEREPEQREREENDRG